MNIILQINGGIGKAIMSTAVCRQIKKQYPDSQLITISGYPEVFLDNPSVDRAFAFG
jgi:ADP-heptose:LPS heptosyltransferase